MGTDGFQIGAFARPWTAFGWEDFLAGAAGAGYEYVGFMRHQEAEVLPGISAEEVAAINESLVRHGVTPTTDLPLHHTTRCPLHLGPDEAVREAFAHLDAMAAVGVKYYMSCGTPDEALYETLYTVFREAAAYGETLGVKVTLKSHGGIGAKCLDLVRVVETVDHDNFGIYFDPGNVLHYTGGDPLENLDDVAPHVVGVCVKDQTGGKGGGVEIEPGTGDVDFPAVFDTLRAGGFSSGPVMVECLGRGELAGVNARAAKVRGLLDEWLA